MDDLRSPPQASGQGVALSATSYPTPHPTGNGSPANVSPQQVEMAPKWGKRVSWLDLPETADSPYKGLKIRVWTNYPNKLDQDMANRQDQQLARDAMKKIFLEHNNWPDPDDEEKVLAPPTTDEFWEKIPNDLAGALIVVLQTEATRYPNSLMPNRNNSRRG